jgi:hypothetical protein
LLRISLLKNILKICVPKIERPFNFRDRNDMNKAKSNIKKVAYKTLTIADKALLGLWEMYDDISYSQIHPRLVLAVGARRAREIVAAKERFQLEREKKKALWRLKENKWIKQKNESDRVEYEITNDGRIAALEAVMCSSDSLLPEGEWCLVVFDFPEPARRSRGIFRRLLKRVGFECIQLSVWQTKKNIYFEINEIIKLLKINHWVRVYQAIDR